MKGQKIAYGTQQHQKILQALRARKDLWKRKSDDLHKALRKAEEAHQFYIKTSDEDAEREKEREQQGKPTQQTLVIPYSYAMALSAHTYWCSVFLSRDPILQFTARHGEPQTQVQAVEAVVNYQVQTGGHLVPYYQWLLDPAKYGFGVLGKYWDVDYTVVSRIEEQKESYYGIELEGKSKRVKVSEKVKSYEGTRCFNVMPWDFIHDPRVSLARFQEGEFCGRLTDSGWLEIVAKEQDGWYFNIDALKKNKARTNELHEDASSVLDLPTDENVSDGHDLPMQDVGTVDLLELFVKLIPEDWGLGKSKYPEIWVFTLANDAVIIGAQPLGEAHGQYPFDVLTNEVDQYTLRPRGFYEILEPMQNMLDWLINTHFYNVRRVLNDTLLVDPSRVVMKDLLQGGPGKMVRAKPSFYGNDMRTAVHQLPIQDVTRQHMQDAEAVMQMMQRVAGVSENVMGVQASGGRKSATEVRQSNSMSINRLKTQAEFMSAQGWAPHSQKLLQMSQQHYEAEMQLRLAGSLVGNDTQFLGITPQDIAGFYDFVAVDGTMPVDRYAQANLFTQMFAQIRQFPELVQGYDLPKIFAYVLQLSGLKNINQFKVEVQPDEQVATGRANGNLQAVGGDSGAGQSDQPRRAGSGVAGSEAAQDPSRVAGMGPAG